MRGVALKVRDIRAGALVQVYGILDSVEVLQVSHGIGLLHVTPAQAQALASGGALLVYPK